MEKLIITPKTKIHDLLEAYPQLEEVLVATAPKFKKLRNPVLRRTVAKITNLGQAAAIGGVNLEDLINELRTEVGQATVSDLGESQAHYNTKQPEWFDKTRITNSLDIREMLHEGEQPVHEVLASIKKLNEDEILEIKAPFIPVPLLDKSISMNYRHWLNKLSDDEYNVYFIKQ